MVNARKFEKVVVTDPIILFLDQWSTLRQHAREIVNARGQATIQDLYQQAEDEKAPICWTQAAARPLEGSELEDAIKDADAVISCWTTIHDDALRNARNLEYVGYWTNLAAHRVNLPLAKELGITVTYVPDYGTYAVSSMALTGILAVLRNLPREIRNTERGSWHFELLKTAQRVPLRKEDIPQDDLYAKKVGIVGFGPIGEQFSRLVRPYDADVRYFSRKRRSRGQEEALGVRFAGLEEIFADSDIVSVHLSPYAVHEDHPDRPYIDADLLSRLRPGAIFSNTSAGNLVDQEALMRLLRDDVVRAYLDVYDGLPPRKELAALSARGNVFTYRAGWFTKGAVEIKGRKFLSNIDEYLCREP
ncbi:MAG: NAD(P)-dependent oxidoreductase [Nanoarchaeota archaeon]